MSDISQLANRALKEANMDKQRGGEIFLDLLTQYPKVQIEFMAKAQTAAMSQEMHLAAHRTRSPSKSQTLAATGTDDSAVIRMAFTYADSLLDGWALACNKPLGDATEEDLEAEAVAEERAANGHLVKARFYRAVKKGMKKKPGKAVRECWTDARIRLVLESMTPAV